MKKFVLLTLAAALAAPAHAQDFDSLAISARELMNTAAQSPFDLKPEITAPAKVKIGLVSLAERKEYITRASLWRPEGELKASSIDFKKGPYEKMKYAPEEVVTCNYVPMKEAYETGRPNGMSPKFKCRDAKGKEFKVKYANKGEVVTEVAASWILTAIGAYADRMYPVRLNCPDCPSDPYKSERDPGAWVQGQPVAIEDKIGERIEYEANSGIGFDEFYLIQDKVGAEALAGLAHFFGNSDNKAPNQALACRKGDVVAGAGGKAVCASPVVYMQDMGISFGGRSWYHNTRMDFRDWEKEKIWTFKETCHLNLHATHTSSLTGVDPAGRDLHQIGEEARQLMVRRLSLLSRQQLTDIFTAARAQQRSGRSAEDWADLYLRKVDKLRRPYGDKTPANFACPYPVVPFNSATPANQYN